MSKHIDASYLYKLPSGASVHPSRLIHRDGTLMWKHALLYNGTVELPQTQAQEQHIIKTAQRLEELNSWVSKDLEPWECFNIHAWYSSLIEELSNGINVYFKHATLPNHEIYLSLLSHIQEHEELELIGNYLYFKRC